MPEQAGALPTFVIIGAMKAGTSSLHYYLGRHPDVSMSTPKELKFFVANADAEDEHPERHFELGLEASRRPSTLTPAIQASPLGWRRSSRVPSSS